VDRITQITKPLVRAQTDLAKTIDELEVLFGLEDNIFGLYKGNITIAMQFGEPYAATCYIVLTEL
jgi:hypothetical protein